MREIHTQVLVIGAGPAGISAATVAADNGLSVCLIDMQAQPGGQIWRGQWRVTSDAAARYWMHRLRDSSVQTEFGARVVSVADSGTVIANTLQGPLRLRCERVVIATGARERHVPFPGWTLPGVCAAGGLQVMVKDGLAIDGKRVVVAGSGPLPLAVAATLRERGAQVLCIAEQANWRGRFAQAAALLRTRQKVRQALGLAWSLRGVPKPTSAWPLRAEGDTRLRRTILCINGKVRAYETDWLAVGFGLVSNLDVAAAFGCEVVDGRVAVDAQQRSSVANVFCAGESTGIGGVDQALAQGIVAGHAVAGLVASARNLRKRDAARAASAALAACSGLRAELRALAAPDTILCRCEDVRVGAVGECRSAREARLHARLGMGWCQGRVCGPAAAFLYGWQDPPPRPPLAPVPISDLDLSTNLSTNRGHTA